MSAGAFSYGLASALFAVLCIGLATRWRGRFGGHFIVAVAAASAVWAALLAWYSLQPTRIAFGTIASVDLLRSMLWFTLLWRLIDDRDQPADAVSEPNTLRRVFVGTCVLVLAANLVVYLHGFMTGVTEYRLIAFIGSGFALALAALVMVEQLFRNSSADVRWTIKFFCLAAGGIFAYDIYLFASGFLFLSLDADLWDARGAVNALAVPLLALSISRSGRLARGQFVSRRVVFYSSALLGVGLYLIVMAAGGYAVRIYGGTWGAFAQILFLSGALLVLAVILFSGQARARVKVFLTKHFLDYRYDYREEWLDLTSALSAADAEHPVSQRSIEAVAGLLESPGGALWLLSEQHYELTRVWNMTVPPDLSLPFDDPLCRFIDQREWIVDLSEWDANPDLYDQLDIPPWLRGIDDAWIIVPLKQGERLLGFMVFARARAMRELTFEDHDLLKTVGRQIAGHLALDQSVQLLAQTRQFQAYNRLTAFIMHDLKNLIAQQSLVVRNAEKHKDKPEFIDDAIDTVANSVQRMNGLLEQLRRGGTERGAKTAHLDSICRDVIKRNEKRKPVPSLTIETADLRVAAPAETLTMVLGHLVRNAQEACSADGSVTLVVGRTGEQAIITIRDTGTGMSPEFIRERLFKPFDTTKGTKGMGIGVYQARDFMRSMGGQLDVTSVPGEGSTFVARLPLDATVDAAPPSSKPTQVKEIH
ncbi:MAG: XrtA/PEP-CTERM system histidine kinase PrsK [Gammaproteobacteria bacterium]